MNYYKFLSNFFINTAQYLVAQLEFFQGGGVFVELLHFDKSFVENKKNKTPQGNVFEIFLLDTLKTTF